MILAQGNWPHPSEESPSSQHTHTHTHTHTLALTLGTSGSTPHLKGAAPAASQNNTATTQAHIQGFELTLRHICPLCDLLEHLKMLGLRSHS